MKEAIFQAGDAFIQLLNYQDDSVRKKIQKGLSLYRQGYVYNLKELEHYVGVVVQDGHEWMVLLNLKDLSKSECDCGDPDFCPHRIAGFFYAYAANGRIGDLLDKWKQQSVSLQAASSFAAFRPKKETAINRNNHSYSVSEWLHFLEDHYERFIQAKLVRSTSIYTELYEHYFLSLTKKAPSLSPYRELFIIHAGLFTFMKICDGINTQKLSKQTFNIFVRTPLSQLVYEVEQHVHKLTQASMPFSADPLLYETMKQIRTLLFYTSALPYERIDLYRMLWTHLFKRPKWIKEEKQYLEHVHDFQLERDVAFAHLLVLEKQDEKAIALVMQADRSIFPYVFKWAKDYIYYKDEQRARMWLMYIKEQMASYIRTLPSYQGSRAFVSMLLSLFESYSEWRGDKTMYTDALRTLLPYSFVEYSQYLYEQKEFRSWLELQAAFRYDILEYDQSILKEIEAENPKWLLPIYHQSIQQSIEKKTRSSYEEAVQHLKDLRQLYKKLQSEQTFTLYLQQLIQSTKRLRAFQEALKKGGFIHD